MRVKVGHPGGSFGAKLYVKLGALVTAADLIVQRPVKYRSRSRSSSARSPDTQPRCGSRAASRATGASRLVP